MEQGQAAALILVDNGKGGAGDPALVAKSCGKATGEGGFAHAQASFVGHHGAGGQGCGQTGACGLRLRLIVTVKLHGLPPPQIVLSIFTIAHSTIFFIYRQIALRMQNGP